jgi:hypothetical protein
LSAQSRCATAHCLTLGHRGDRSSDGVGTGFVQDALGQLTRLGPIPLGTGDDGLGRGIRPRCRHQRVAAAVRGELITATSRDTIQPGGSLEQSPIVACVCIQCQVTTAADKHPMSTAQRFDFAFDHSLPS